MAEIEKNIGESRMSEEPRKPMKFMLSERCVKEKHLADSAVTTMVIKDKNVTPEKLSNDVKGYLTDELYSMIESMEKGGVALSQQFGDKEYIGISQKTLTIAINKIWEKIEEMTGEVLHGMSMAVTPDYFVSETGADVHITASTVETNGVFEKIQFFVDGELIYDGKDTEYVSFDYELPIKDTYDYVVMCKAKILGVEYPKQQVITRYNEFYIGAGDTYTDIMDSTHARQLNGTLRHNYDIEFSDGQKLIIVMGASLREGFMRADLNGVEIQMSEETVTIDNKDYVVLTSGSWSEGTYNIDING